MQISKPSRMPHAVEPRHESHPRDTNSSPRTLPASFPFSQANPAHGFPSSGGTDVMVQYSRNTSARKLVSIWNFQSFAESKLQQTKYKLARMHYTDFAQARSNQQGLPLLSSAASGRKESPTRTCGTLGGTS